MRRRALFAGLVVALLPLLFYWRLWAPPPAERLVFAEGDLSSQYYPLRLLGAAALAEGRLPLWNPYAFAGQPGFADPQMATLYPPQSLWALASGGVIDLGSLEAQAILHLSLAAAGAFLLIYRLCGSVAGGAVAGIAFAFGGYLTGFPMQQITILSTVAWLPWLLLCLERLIAGPRRAGAGTACLAVLFAAAVLAGHPQTAMLVAYGLAAYAVVRLCQARPRRRRVVAVVAGPLVGGLMAAVQLLPTLEFIRHSSRAGIGFAEVAAGFGLHEVVAALWPGYFGGSPQYAGVATLALAALALAALPPRATAFWAGLSLTGLLLSFGGDTALFRLAYLLLPGFATSRNQERAIVFFAFGAAVLAGLGVAALRRPTPHRVTVPASAGRLLTWATIVALAFGLVLLAGTHLPPPAATGVNLFGGVLQQHLWVIAGLGLTALLARLTASRRLRPDVSSAALAVLIALNLYSVNSRYGLVPWGADDARGAVPAVRLSPSAETAAHLRAALGPGQRVASGGLLPEGPNAGMVYRFADTGGNTPLQLGAYAGFSARLPEWRRWQLLAVSHVLLPAGVEPEDGLILERDGDPALHRVTEPAPPLRLLHEATYATGEDAWAALASPAHDPLRRAVLATDGPPLAPAVAPEGAVVVSWAAEEVVAAVEVSAPAILVFSLPAYPGWRATVDGAPADTVVSDLLFIGVPVSEGSHTIVLRYRPLSVTLGLLLSVVGLCLTLAAIIGPRVPLTTRGRP